MEAAFSNLDPSTGPVGVEEFTVKIYEDVISKPTYGEEGKVNGIMNVRQIRAILSFPKAEGRPVYDRCVHYELEFDHPRFAFSETLGSSMSKFLKEQWKDE